jgi:solute carrier family 1 (high affinity glutamate transporter) protein 1
LGIAVTALFAPGAGVLMGAAAENAARALPAAPASAGQVVEDLVRRIFSDNLLAAMVQGNLLPLILFSAVFAGILTTMGRRAEPITRLVNAADGALLTFVMLLMRLAPFGIFCLVAARFGQAIAQGRFRAEIAGLLEYVLVVIGGLAIYMLVALPLVLLLVARRNPLHFARAMSDALLTAFSTASSAATLPVTLECAEKQARIERRAAEFVLPLAVMIKKDGTALFQAATAVFIAQAYGIELGFAALATIFVTASLASLGTAGVPEAGIVTIVIVLNAVNLPIEGIGLILAIDWFLDRFRTAVNVASDAVAAAVVERSIGRA